MRPWLSIVVLTWNEEDNIEDCLTALAAQRDQGFEVIVVDAASTDATVGKVNGLMPAFPVPLRLVVADERIPIGEARNRGVALAKAPHVAFLSADAEAEPDWTQEARRSLRSHGMVFGRQLHAPRRWTLGAAVRGLRYVFPEDPPPDPLVYASNVAAVFDRRILERHPFDPSADAAEDLLVARRAAADGHRAVYNPRMVVRHHDVRDVREEMRKNLREGRGWGRHASELGVFWPLLGWGAAMGLAAGMAMRRRTGIMLLAATVWAPATRRAVHGRSAMPMRRLLPAVLASPVFDGAFLVQYLNGLRHGADQESIA